ncbi:MAG: VWA domain-containing protein [Candidatus Limnocylindrales bacterium]
MSFIWPFMLVSLALIPLGVLLYALLDRSRRRRLARYGGSGLAVGPGRRGFRSRIPAALMLFGLVFTALAIARPQAVVSLPRQEGTVILAFDVSASMGAKDMAPTRIAAAKTAAKDFVARQPLTISIGVVAFSDSGVSVQAPSNDLTILDDAIDRLTPQKGTSVASGITASLKVIAAQVAGYAGNDFYTNPSAAPSPTPTPTPVPAGTHAPAVIVLLSDGENNENPDPKTAAQTAADRGVRVYTVGIGSAAGTTLDLNGFEVFTRLDEATLQGISQVTGGTYYNATDAAGLRSIYDNIDVGLVLRPQLTEITALFAAMSLLLMLAGVLTSLLWLGRVP